jgi:penicillin-binding protein-related factor A (putative recombinase)
MRTMCACGCLPSKLRIAWLFGNLSSDSRKHLLHCKKIRLPPFYLHERSSALRTANSINEFTFYLITFQNQNFVELLFQLWKDFYEPFSLSSHQIWSVKVTLQEFDKWAMKIWAHYHLQIDYLNLYFAFSHSLESKLWYWVVR